MLIYLPTCRRGLISARKMCYLPAIWSRLQILCSVDVNICEPYSKRIPLTNQNWPSRPVPVIEKNLQNAL